MSVHLTAEDVERFVDGEAEERTIEQHLPECSRCASAVLAVMQMKRAIHEDMLRYSAPATLRARVMQTTRPRTAASWWFAAAAVIAIAVASAVLVRSRNAAMRELVDLHTTLLASANPVDVVSIDRHTVKPWFEGRVPFAVPIPDLSATPFRLIGGRVVFWRRQPGAYLLLGKAAHRVSLFIFPDDVVPQSIAAPREITLEVWRSNGLAYVVVADIPAAELAPLRKAFGARI